MASFGRRARAAGALAAFWFVLAGTGACGGSSKPAMSPSGEGGGAPEIGKPAPELSIETLNGKGTISLSSLNGKVAIVDFWATWCAPCKQSFPKFEELAKKHAGNVEIVAVSCDESKDGVLDWANQQGATFAIGWDEGHTLAKRWAVDTMPTTFIIDASGTVRHIHASYHDDEPEKIDKELMALINEGGSKAKTAVASSSSTADKPPEPPPAASATATAEEPPAPPPAAPGKKPGGKGGAPKPPGKKKPAGKPKR
jgi:thiol-disulfide isomerase/thioredoxin